jgi:hypothetical protein
MCVSLKVLERSSRHGTDTRRHHTGLADLRSKYFRRCATARVARESR